MGIADVRRALETGADGKATFQDVKLGYRDGGAVQLLSFKYKLNKDGTEFAATEREFPGTRDPVKDAFLVGQELAAEFDAT